MTVAIEKKETVRRIFLKDLNMERIASFEAAVKDFIARYKEDASTFFGTWRWIISILSQGGMDEVWGAFDGDRMTVYFMVTPQQELNGDWYLFIHQAWGDPVAGAEVNRGHLKMVCEDAFKRGCKSVKFLTLRNGLAFKEWLPAGWESSRTLFEIRNGK